MDRITPGRSGHSALREPLFPDAPHDREKSHACLDSLPSRRHSAGISQILERINATTSASMANMTILATWLFRLNPNFSMLSHPITSGKNR